jgi:hypothetical protein
LLNTSPDMSPMPNRERRRGNVEVHLMEVSPDRLQTPHAKCRSSWWSLAEPPEAKVAKPEAMFSAIALAISRRSRCLVGGDHQIGIVVVVAHDIGGRTTPASLGCR